MDSSSKLRRLKTQFLSHYCISVLSLLVVTAQRVQFRTFTNVVIIGQRVYFVCTADMFNHTRDRVEITYNDDLLVRFDNGNVTYYIQEFIAYYESDILNHGDTDDIVGVAFVIKEAHERDAGKYQCRMKLSGEKHNSLPIGVEVKQFPKPTCGVESGPIDITYEAHGSNGILLSNEGINVTLRCSIDNISTDNVDVLLQWTRSDGENLAQPYLNRPIDMRSASIYVPLTSDADNVTYTCISKNSTYRGFTHTCTINVFVTMVTIVYKPLEPTTGTVTVIHENNTTGGDGISPELFGGAGAAIGMLIVLLLIILAAVCISRNNSTEGDNKRKNTPYYSSVPVEPKRTNAPYYSLKIPNLRRTKTEPDNSDSMYYLPTKDTDIKEDSTRNSVGVIEMENMDSNEHNHDNEHIYEILENGTLDRSVSRSTEL